jgi:diguanylate cyclase (GGDEF)-like protein
MGNPLEANAHVLRARRTAAVARVSLASVGIALVAIDPDLAALPLLSAAGFAFIVLTSSVQLVAPRSDWLTIEESIAGIAGLLIIGLGDQRVSVLSVLWLAAVASGVLARGGRVHWIGSVVVLTSLTLPIVLRPGLTPQHAGLCVAVLGLLLTCGRLTRELNHLLTRARWDADHDGLTGALSRTAFRDALSEVAARGPDHAATLLMIDLDSFGQVNKQNGHAAGDTLLVTSAERIHEVLGPDVPVGRLGGDEFAAVLENDTGEPADVANRLLDALSRPAEGVMVPASIGIAQAPAHGRDAEALLRAADVALRMAKRGGVSRVSTYAGASFGEEGPRGARGALARLIEGDGIAMVVQPIVDLVTGGVHAYEALARFRTRGTESPLHWFALADEFGLRDELELACLRAALDLLPQRPGGAALTVNLSGPVLADPRAQQVLAAVPDLSGLIIEVTEQALVMDGAGLQAAVAPLLERGVRLAIDDMGAGYSGLRQITAVHPAYLKLDRSLIQKIEGDPDRRALLEALVGYARHTGAQLVAEGVETAAELDTIAALGITLIQGYLFARPQPPWPAVDIRGVGEPVPGRKVVTRQAEWVGTERPLV